MWLRSPLISCPHGFSTRAGGVSAGPFTSLNLGGPQDDPEKIEQNRQLALKEFGAQGGRLCILKQVHGSQVCLAREGRQEGDAIVTNEIGLLLAVSIADCYPVLLYDDTNKVIAAAHAGWRGVRSHIISKTIEQMKRIGADARNIKVAIGQGICRQHFEVGKEVIDEFINAGFPVQRGDDNKIDLPSNIIHDLLNSGITENNVWTMGRCTFEPEFFSYRRDMGLTGRMWAAISMK
jgi:polyphenol oxidase